MGRKVNCYKCQGTGFIQRFANYQSGICFDCDGSGKVPATASARKLSPLQEARLIAKRVLRGEPVSKDEVVTAWETYEDTFRGQWVRVDYTYRNGLGRHLGLIIAQ